MTRRAWIFCLLAVVAPALAEAATLDRIKQSGAFKIGYREDAQPFAFKNAIGEIGGYSVELCRAVAAAAKEAVGLSDIRLEYVPVTTEDRFAAVRDGRVDILCGATTQTLSRRELVDFSLPTFIDGASVLFRADGPTDFKALAGHRVGVRGDTTTEEALRNTLRLLKVEAEVVPVADHGEGLSKLEDNGITAYFADRAILVFLALNYAGDTKLRLSEQYFTQEPYALALARGDADFRLLVDRTLSRLYRSGQITGIFRKSFGERAEPTDLLRALYVIGSLPE